MPWRSEGAAGAERFRKELSAKEDTWVALVGPHLESLGSTPLSAEESSHLTFMHQARLADEPAPAGRTAVRQHRVPRTSRAGPAGNPVTGAPAARRADPWTHLVTHGIVPTLLAALLGLLLYRHLVVPLNRLRDRADALRADELESTPLAAPLAARRDELGEAGPGPGAHGRAPAPESRPAAPAAANPVPRTAHAAGAACASPTTASYRRNSCASAWIAKSATCNDCWKTPSTSPGWTPSARNCPPSRCWRCRCGALRDDACFESGWDPARLPCRLGVDCRVEVHLDSLAQAMENLLRNAIRHSPEDGTVSLDGEREGDFWHLRLQDQGPGVAEDQLERIFLPTSAWTIAPAKVSASAWRSPGAPSSYRAAGSGPATASPDCACTCGCRRRLRAKCLES